MSKSVMVIYGTRPEAVKVAPLIQGLQTSKALRPFVVSTGQHRELMDQVNRWFGIKPDLDLQVFRQGSNLNELASRILGELDPVLEEHAPDAVVVQGDTTSVASAALASFYRGIPVVHLEAGLRSGNIHSPFPEEANRRVAGQLTSLHLAPTTASRDNLLREGTDPRTVVVVGNTVIDALQWTAAHDVAFSDDRLRAAHKARRRMILLTTHRRENWGDPMRHIGQAVATLARRYPETLIVFPAHANPLVLDSVGPAIQGLDNIVVCAPMPYEEFVHAQKWASLVLTDSGGVQEEAPSFGTPVLVLRENTERPEAIAAGTAKLIGTETGRIVSETSSLLDDPDAHASMSKAVNPYGDGRASQRVVAAIAEMLGVGERLPDFAVEP